MSKRIKKILARSEVRPYRGLEYNTVRSYYKISGCHLLVDVAKDPQVVKGGFDGENLQFIDVNKCIRRINKDRFHIDKMQQKMNGR